MFSDVKDVNKNKDFVGRAQNARQIRAEEKKREQAAVKIQVDKLTEMSPEIHGKLFSCSIKMKK